MLLESFRVEKQLDFKHKYCSFSQYICYVTHEYLSNNDFCAFRLLTSQKRQRRKGMLCPRKLLRSAIMGFLSEYHLFFVLILLILTTVLSLVEFLRSLM